MTGVRVLPAGELTPALVASWARIQRGNAIYASPFLHPAFTQLVSRARPDVHVAVLERGGEAVGFFPFQRSRLGIGRPAGWSMCDYQAVVVDSDVEWSAQKLMAACGLRSLEFDHLLAAQEQFLPFHRAKSASLVADLSNGFDDYERGQQRAGIRTFGRLRSRWRRLEREHGPVRFEPHATDPAALTTLLAWKSAQYRHTGVADLLAQPWFRQVIESASRAASDGFGGLLSALYANDRPVALHLGLRSDSVWHYWLPAHEADPAFSRCSPGLLLILAMTQHAESVGIRALDFGKGETRHKREFANAEVPLAEGSVGTSALAKALRWRRRARALAQRTALGPRARRLVNRGLSRS